MQDYEAIRVQNLHYLETQIKALQAKVDELGQKAVWCPKIDATADAERVVFTMELCGKRQGVAVTYENIDALSVQDLSTAITDSFKSALFDDMYRPLINEKLEPYKAKAAQIIAMKRGANVQAN